MDPCLNCGKPTKEIYDGDAYCLNCQAEIPEYEPEDDEDDSE